MLQPFDIIQGAQSPAHPKVFVIGAFDSRITFYSQQLRALSLVHALRDQGFLKDGVRIGVVGGGAAGVTAAAAAVLLSTGTVDLYERGDDVLPLQSATQRRRLDPHIYGWPALGSEDPAADLPLLDWTAGTAQEVRRDVKQEFEAVFTAMAPRLRVHLRHDVTAARALAPGLQLDFLRHLRPDEAAASAGPVPGQAMFDVLLLAFGFGLEQPYPIPGVTSASYWSEAGVPVAEFEGRTTPRFLVSGNGDGGLIDLVAAASAHFDHAGMIREITEQPGIERIFERLEAIDARALSALGAGTGFDFLGTYDTEIRADLQGMGLLQLVTARLRPGVQITFQTLKPEAFSIETATLNRVAAYLVIRALEAAPQTQFTHLHGNDLALVPAPTSAIYSAPLWFTCAGQTFGVDAAIVRRGPERAAARQPFADLLGDYFNTHKAWLGLHGDSTVAPTLSSAARQAFLTASRAANLPLATHVQRAMQSQQPFLLRVQPKSGGMHWSGDLEPDAIASLWDDGANSVDIFVPGPPAGLGPVAAALVRVALHSERATLVADVADWRPFADPLTSSSAHAEHLAPLLIRPGHASGATRDPRQLATPGLATTLHRELDRWVIEAVNQRISEYIATGRDPGHVIGFESAGDLRVQMAQVWGVWLPQFRADPDLLDHFLRLVVCAEDDDGCQEEARVLVGRRKLPLMVRAIAAVLAVASAWPQTLPRGQRPGNLSRTLTDREPWQGHACAADLIRREPTAIAAAGHLWRTHFVFLSQLNTPMSLATQVETGLADIEEIQPSIAQTTGSVGIILTLDASFRTAAGNSLPALAALLLGFEEAHFARLNAAIIGS